MNLSRDEKGGIKTGRSALICAVVAAALALSPALAAAADPGLDFGAVPVAGTSVTKPLTVTNLDAQELEVDGSTLTGPDAADFEIVSDGCAAATLAFEESCQVLLRATPSALGAQSASLEIVDDAASGPHAFPLTVTGIEAEAGATGSEPAAAGSSTVAGETGLVGPGPTIRGLGTPLKPRASGWVAVAVVECPAASAEACEVTSARASLLTGHRTSPVAVRTPRWIQPGQSATIALVVPLMLAERLAAPHHSRATVKVGLRAVAVGGAGVERSLRRVLIP